MEGASSISSFIRVEATEGETVSDLRFNVLNDQTTQNKVVGMQTVLNSEDLYLHVDASGNYATLTTAAGSGGRIVAAFALTNEVINNTTHISTAGVQMVTFEAIKHNDTTVIDETLPITDVLQIDAVATLRFDFDQLDAGNFLWAAVGSTSGAMLVTGQDLNVKASGIIDKGGTDSSDAVNTSKATETTIGINAQHFAPTGGGANQTDGATGVFTFVKGFAPIAETTPQFTGDNVNEIQYDNYINTSAATVFISQLTGGSTASMRISLWEAGGGEAFPGFAADHAPGALVAEEGQTGTNSYIGSDSTDSHLRDDTKVNVASVEVRGFTWFVGDSGELHNGITVTISNNVVTVLGAQADDSIKITAEDTASLVDGTFNRLQIQALADSASFDIGHIDLSQGASVGQGLGSHLFVDDDGPGTFDPVDITYDPSTPANNLKNQAGEAKLNVDLTSASNTTLTGIVGTDGLKATNPLVFYDSDTTDNLLKGTVGTGSLQTLTSGGTAIHLYGYGTDILTASTQATFGSGLDPTKTVFTVSLDASGDNYDFNMLGHIDNGAVSAFVNFQGQKQTIYEWLTLDLPNQLEANPPTPDDGDLLFTGVQRTNVTDFGDLFTAPPAQTMRLTSARRASASRASRSPSAKACSSTSSTVLRGLWTGRRPLAT